jgi:hypothetical protein
MRCDLPQAVTPAAAVRLRLRQLAHPMGLFATLEPSRRAGINACVRYWRRISVADIRLPIKKIHSARHLRFVTGTDPNKETDYTLEMYSGSVAVDRVHVSDTVDRQRFKILIPVEDTKLQFYYNQEIHEAVVCVAPGGHTGTDDEENLVSVDEFKVELEPQDFNDPAIFATPPCLVLYFNTALKYATLHRVSYSISFTIKLSQSLDGPKSVDGDFAPA